MRFYPYITLGCGCKCKFLRKEKTKNRHFGVYEIIKHSEQCADPTETYKISFGSYLNDILHRRIKLNVLDYLKTLKNG